MRLFGLFFALSILLFDVTLAQTNPPVRQGQRTREEVVRDDLERRMNNMRNANSLGRSRSDNRRNRSLARTYRPSFSKELEKEMAIDQSLLIQHKEFLAGQRTGIVKLIPMSDCKGIKKDKKLRKCLQSNANIREYSNSFSFRESKRAVFARADLALNRDYFVTGLHSVQTIIVNLGEVPIDELGLDSKGTNYLDGFEPGQEEGRIDNEYNLFRNGITLASFSDGIESKLNFAKQSKIENSATYGLRAISYRPQGAVKLPKDQDVIVILKVVRIDKNGAVTFVFRELKRSDGVEMKVEKEPVPPAKSVT